MKKSEKSFGILKKSVTFVFGKQNKSGSVRVV